MRDPYLRWARRFSKRMNLFIKDERVSAILDFVNSRLWLNWHFRAVGTNCGSFDLNKGSAWWFKGQSTISLYMGEIGAIIWIDNDGR